MNSSIKKIFAFTIAVIMLLGATPVLVLPEGRAKAMSYDGSCGENLTWSFDEETGALSVKGFGAMTNYSPSAKAPWYDYRDSIKTVALPRGLTSIGDYAFEDCSSLTSVTIDESKDILDVITDSRLATCESFDGAFAQPYISSDNPDDIALAGFNAVANGKQYTQKTREIIIDVIEGTSELDGSPIVYVNVTYHYKFTYLVQQTGGMSSGTLRPTLFEKDIVYSAIPAGASLHPDGSPLSCCIMYYPVYGTTDNPENDTITINNLDDIPIKLFLIKQWQTVYSEEDDEYKKTDSVSLDALEKNYKCEIKEIHSENYDLIADNEKQIYTNARINLTTYGSSNEEISGVTFKAYSGFIQRTRTGLIRDGVLFSLNSIGNSAFKGCTSLEDVLYVGTKAEWSAINIAENNECLVNASVHFCKSGEHIVDFKIFSHYQAEHPHYAVYKCECGAERISKETTKLDSCEFCNPAHICEFTIFSHYQNEHPHYAVYKCECGAEQISEETTELEACEICNPHICEFTTLSHYQEEHPHYAVYKCECGAEQISEETTELEACEICNPPHICEFTILSHYQDEHPHYAVYKCECGAEQISTETTKLDSCKICNPSISRGEAEIKRPSTSTIDYGDSIVLHFDVDVQIPVGARIVWSADNGNFRYSASADGKTCTITPQSSGDTVFTARVVDASGKAISEEYTQKMTANAGFFQKLVAFFKKLFGSTKIIAQAYNFDF